jgi:hypothetical protein
MVYLIKYNKIQPNNSAHWDASPRFSRVGVARGFKRCVMDLPGSLLVSGVKEVILRGNFSY